MLRARVARRCRSEWATAPALRRRLYLPAIASAAGPEEYSWQAELGPADPASVDEDEAVVEYENGVAAFTITAETAHAADGAEVPTTLEVSEGDVVTQIVHHREGAFVYPVLAGERVRRGPRTTIIVGPPDEAQLAAEKRRIEAKPSRRTDRRGATGALQGPVPTRPLAGGAKARLRAAHCAIGTVRLVAPPPPTTARS